MNLCAVCKIDAKQSCSLCNSVYYCNREHQKADWKSHKHNCAPFKIQSNQTLGRYLIASRDIKAGEIIIKKQPLVLGPKIASYPLCLGCHKRLNITQEQYKCSKCKWPMCGSLCEKLPSHIAECAVFTKNQYHPFIQDGKQGVYSLIAPLRALLLKTDSKKYESLMSMQSHLKENFNTPLYKILRANLIPILESLKIHTNDKEFLTICSILDTNSYEIRTEGLNIRGVFPLISLISHDCKVNSKHSFHGPNHEMHFIATTDINKGDIIASTYTQTLWSTMARRAHLKQAKNFDCCCKRCSDPTEFGTYAGSILCNCKNLLVSLDPLDPNSDWKCEKCPITISSEYIKNVNEEIKREIYSIDRSSPAYFEEFLKNYETILHDTNCHVLEVKYALIQMYGNVKGYKLNGEDLHRKIDLCKELLAVADILEPGHSRFRGYILNELQEATVEKIKRENAINSNQYQAELAKCVSLLMEATDILESEPDMGAMLRKNLQNIIQMQNKTIE